MALFYNQADQDIYTGGDHFIPQEQYRLGNFNPASPSIANASNTGGLTTIPQGGPYMGYPSYAAYLAAQPGGGGGGGTNITSTYDPNQNLGTTNITDYEADADDVSSTWAGSWAKAKEDFSKVPSLFKAARWGFNKISEMNKARKEKAKADAKKAAGYDESGGWKSPSGRDHGSTGGIGSPESQQGGQPGTQGAGFSHADGGIVGLAQGGRIGFNKGGNYAQNAIANQLFGSSFDVLDPFQQDQIDSLISQVGTTSLGILKAQGGRVPFFYGGLASIL